MTWRLYMSVRNSAMNGQRELDKAIQTVVTDAELTETQRAWLDLLDRLGKRDIQEFSGLIQAKCDENLRRPAPAVRVLRSAHKNTRRSSIEQDEVFQYRRDWLQFWIHYFADGSRSTIEAMLGYGKSYIAQCLDPDYYGGRSIGERAARLIEMRLGRPAKSMDMPFFPFWDTPQSESAGTLNEEQKNWLGFLGGLTEAQVRELTIMVHARRQHNLELMQRYGFFAAPSRPVVAERAVRLDKFQNRRAWLRHWIDTYAGGRSRTFADLCDLDWSIPSQYLSLTYNSGRGLSDKAARRIEAALGLPEGSMDQPFMPSDP